MKTPQKVLESVSRALTEDVDYSQVTDEQLIGITQEIRKAELALHTLLEKSRQTAVSKRFDLFVDIANGK